MCQTIALSIRYICRCNERAKVHGAIEVVGDGIVLV